MIDVGSLHATDDGDWLGPGICGITQDGPDFRRRHIGVDFIEIGLSQRTAGHDSTANDEQGCRKTEIYFHRICLLDGDGDEIANFVLHVTAK